MHDTAPGTFIIYDTLTGEKCQRYPFNVSFPDKIFGYGRRYLWLPNGGLLTLMPDGQLIQTDTPCGTEIDLTSHFPEKILNIFSLSPDGTHLLLTGDTAYWLYNWQSQEAYPITEITPHALHHLVWSPNSTYIGATLAEDISDNNSVFTGARVINAVTGQIITRYNWELIDTVFGMFGTLVWLNENEMIFIISQDQGPLFMTVAGEIRPVLPLFNQQFEPGSYPRIQVYVEPGASQYHILLNDEYDGTSPIRHQIYHSGSGTVETPDILGRANLSTNGQLIVDIGGVFASRHITAANEPFSPLPHCVWPTENQDVPYGAHIPDHNRTVDIYTLPDCDLLSRVKLDGYHDGRFRQEAHISPDGNWLIVILTDNFSHNVYEGQILFLVRLDDLN